MKSLFLALVITLTCSANAFAQRDAPVWSSFLARISMFDERSTLDFEFTYKKSGGPHEQSSHAQAYVLAYLEKDKPRITELAADKILTTKSDDKDALLLEVLVAEKLAVVLGTKVVTQSKAPLVISPQSGRTSRGASCFDFDFSFDNRKLFELVQKLKHFDKTNFVDSDHRYYNDKFKLMIFVPVNDCRYATKIPKQQREFYDFAHFMDGETILQYFKPLPYRFQFKPLDEEGVVLLYID